MQNEKQGIFSADTLIPFGLVMSLCAAALSFGVMWQKVEGLRSDMAELKTSVLSLNSKVDTLLINRSAVSMQK